MEKVKSILFSGVETLYRCCSFFFGWVAWPLVSRFCIRTKNEIQVQIIFLFLDQCYFALLIFFFFGSFEGLKLLLLLLMLLLLLFCCRTFLQSVVLSSALHKSCIEIKFIIIWKIACHDISSFFFIRWLCCRWCVGVIYTQKMYVLSMIHSLLKGYCHIRLRRCLY